MKNLHTILDFNESVSEWAKSLKKNFESIRQRSRARNHATNVYENHKLIVYMRNQEYFALWVNASDLNKQREAFANQTHLIADSQIDACFMLKVTMKSITVLNTIDFK